MIKLLKESYGDLSDYLEKHLDSWYGRLDELGEDIEDLGLDVDEINNEYVIVHSTEPDGEDVYCKIWLGGTSRTISLETFEMLESVRRPKNVLRESDDKITARTFQELISKLEDHGYSCEHYYDMKYPESNWLYITKNGDPYEAEFYRYSDGEYELYLHNIHPTKRRNESVKRRKQVKENFYRVWYNPYLLEPDEEDFVEVTAKTVDEARRRVSSKGYVTSVEEIESLTNPYDESKTRSKRNKLMEKSNFDDTEKAINYFYKSWKYDGLTFKSIYTQLKRLGHSQDFIDAVLDGITERYEKEEDYELDDYDDIEESIQEPNVVGDVEESKLPKRAKDYLKSMGWDFANIDGDMYYTMHFSENEDCDLYIDEFGNCYLVVGDYDVKPTDMFYTIVDEYKNDIDDLMKLGDMVASGNDVDKVMKLFFD